MDFMEIMKHMNVDVDDVLNRFSGNHALMERFIRKFPQDKTYCSLQEAYQTLNYEQLERAAHTLKGIAANLGFSALFGYCSELVVQLRNRNTNHIDEYYNHICEEYEMLIHWISQLQ